MRGRWLVALYLGVIVVPLMIASLSERPPRPFWDEVASGMGMVAFSILLAEFLLSGRFRQISAGVGMDVTMRFHQLLARSVLGLVILHPFLYSTPFAFALPFDPTREMTLVQPGVALAAGAVAWVLLPAFVLISMARADVFKRYENWRLGHGLGAAVIACAAWYHVTRAGRYAADPVLFWIWTALLGVALLSLLSVYLLRPLMQKRRPWRVEEIKRAADRTWAVDLVPDGHDGLRFKAGQFAWLNIGHSPFSLSENPFSIASAPAERPRLRFLIKELGDFTSTLGRIPAGTHAFVDGPFGHLCLEDHQAPGIALLAGGVGIAPMLSILRQLQAIGDCRPVSLVYGNRSIGQMACASELKSWAEEDGHEFIPVLSEAPEAWFGETGMMDHQLLQRHFDKPERRAWAYVLCGPPAMMSAAERALLSFGVPPENILSERFSYD